MHSKSVKSSLAFLIVILLTLVSCSSTKNKADKMKERAEVSMEAQQYQSAIGLAGEALELYTLINDTTNIIETYYLLSRASALSDNFEDAIKYAEPGIKLSRSSNNLSLEYRLNNILNWSYFTLGKSFDETIELQERQLIVVEKLDDDEAKAHVYNNYSYDATVAGSVPLPKVIDYMKFVNAHYAKEEGTKGRWYTLMNLTWQHRLINDLQKSEEYGRLSVDQARKDNDRHAIIEAHTNLGETLLAQGRVEEAKPYYEEALTKSREEEDRDKFVFDVYYSKYLWETDQREESISLLKKAVNFLENSEVFYEMLGRAYLAEFSLLSGDLEEAENQLSKFANPRANYFSKESKIIAATVEAQLVLENDKEKALEILKEASLQLDKSGALLLKNKVTDLITRINAEG